MSDLQMIADKLAEVRRGLLELLKDLETRNKVCGLLVTFFLVGVIRRLEELERSLRDEITRVEEALKLEARQRETDQDLLKVMDRKVRVYNRLVELIKHDETLRGRRTKIEVLLREAESEVK